jgi:hypothetical protein
MDISLITAASGALNAAREIGKAAIGIRDSNQLAVTVSQLNDQILKAQDALFSHQSQLLAIQQELIQTQEKLRQAEKLIKDRGAYHLVALSPGVFVYGSNPVEDGADIQPAHYLCQPCFDIGKTGILIRKETAAHITHGCPLCKTEYLEKMKPVQPFVPRRSIPFTGSR